MEAQLIIRAPNQNIEDQVINCNMDWTVLKLKIHLSEVYPNRPIVQEQKLIYSGRLLHDHLQLKDIIRLEDMQSNTQILHLVCNGKYSLSSPEQNPGSSQNSSNQSTPDQSGELREDSSRTSAENILRHRPNSIDTQVNNFQPQFLQAPVNPVPVFPNDPQMLAQVAAMQQMYAQYVSQYWQNLNMSSSTGNLFPVVSNTQSQQNNSNNVTHEAAAPQPANQRVNVPVVQAFEDDANRDWWDHVFLYLRFLILLSIVYFYSTPERFMLVIIVVVIAFLYHEGWFVRQGIAEAVMGQRNRGQAEQNANAVNTNEQPLPNENEGNDGHELEAAMDGEDPPHAQNPDVANNNQVFSPLTFLTTFFSSLIPEPPPPVNIN